LRFGLFKQDHITEYVPGTLSNTNKSDVNKDKKISSKNSTNYHKQQFFEKLKEITNTKSSSFVDGDGQLIGMAFNILINLFIC